MKASSDEEAFVDLSGRIYQTYIAIVMKNMPAASQINDLIQCAEEMLEEHSSGQLSTDKFLRELESYYQRLVQDGYEIGFADGVGEDSTVT